MKSKTKKVTLIKVEIGSNRNFTANLRDDEIKNFIERGWVIAKKGENLIDVVKYGV